MEKKEFKIGDKVNCIATSDQLRAIGIYRKKLTETFEIINISGAFVLVENKINKKWYNIYFKYLVQADRQLMLFEI